MAGRLSVLLAQTAVKSRQAFVTAKRWAGIARDVTARYAGVTYRTLKRGTFHSLGPIERVLLNGRGREVVHATATFAMIFLFAITSVDFLIGGGPDFGSPARRDAQPVRMVRIEAPTTTASAAPAVAEEAVPTEVSSSLATARAANVLAVSQSFAPAPIRRAAASEAPAEASAPQTAEPLADAEAAVAEAAAETPRKHLRTKDDPAPV